MKVSQAFLEVGELCVAAGQAPLNKHDGCWEYQVDDHWWIAVNGHSKPRLCSKSNVPVEPYTCLVMFNEWPAGLFSPFGGIIAAGECANEQTFIDAIRQAVKRLNP